MNQLNMEPIQADRASIEVLDSPEGAVLKFTGTLDQAQPGELLAPMFDRLHQGVLERRIPHVTVDLSEMDFLNSSGIKLLAGWVLKRGALAPDERYGLRVIYAGHVTWQVATLRALEAIARGTLQTECR